MLAKRDGVSNGRRGPLLAAGRRDDLGVEIGRDLAQRRMTSEPSLLVM
jgi:hypothetical protein